MEVAIWRRANRIAEAVGSPCDGLTQGVCYWIACKVELDGHLVPTTGRIARMVGATPDQVRAREKALLKAHPEVWAVCYQLGE